MLIMKYIFLNLSFWFLFSTPLMLAQSGEFHIPDDIIKMTDCSLLESYLDIESAELLAKDIQQNIFFSYEPDTLNMPSDCASVVRFYNFINWDNGYQLDSMNRFDFVSELEDRCVQNVVIDRTELPLQLDARSMINGSNNRTYSFEIFDPEASEMVLPVHFSEDTTILIYNHEDAEVCLLNPITQFCSEGFSWDIQTNTNFDLGNNYCRTIVPSDLVTNIQYQCGTYDLGFIDQNGVWQESLVLQGDAATENREITLALEAENGERFLAQVPITVSRNPIIAADFPVMISSSAIQANQSFELDAQVSAENVNYIEFRLYFQDAEFLDQFIVHPALSGFDVNLVWDEVNDVLRGQIGKDDGNLGSVDILNNLFSVSLLSENDAQLSDLFKKRLSYIHLYLSEPGCAFNQRVECPIDVDETSNVTTSIGGTAEIVVFPNPATEVIFIQLKNTESINDKPSRISLWNAQGQCVREWSRVLHHDVNRLNIQSMALPEGYYYLSIYQNGTLSSLPLFIK
jgi:hypothetical protein